MDLNKDVITARELLEGGTHHYRRKLQVAAGELAEFARGVLLNPAAVDHLSEARAAVAASGSGSVASHLTAGRVYGLAGMYGLRGIRGGSTRDRLAHVTLPSPNGVRSPQGIRVHRCPLKPSEVVEIDGIPVTSVLRTLADLLLTQTREIALVAVEDAIHRELITVEEVGRASMCFFQRPGARRARLNLQLVSGRCWSALETVSRLGFLDGGLQIAAQNMPVRTDQGIYLPDFLFIRGDRRVVGEADGRAEHEKPRARVDDSRREEALQRAGFRVVRWDWADAADMRAVIRRIEALL